MTVLSRLVDDPARFLDGWPGRPAVYQPKGARLDELFNRDAARRIVSDPTLRPIELGMVREGRPDPVAPDADHPTHTLVFNGLHLTWQPLREAARVLAAELGHPVTANVYLTPPASAGYGPHWDTHHVLLAQIEGAKTWRLHPPIVADPLDRHRWTAVGFTSDQLDQVHRDAETITLTAGQALYIPRGWVHFGHTGSAEHSLHITFGVQLLTRHWLVQQLTDQAANDPAMREALPPGLSSYPVDRLVDETRVRLRTYLEGLTLAEAARPIFMRQQRAVLGIG